MPRRVTDLCLLLPAAALATGCGAASADRKKDPPTPAAAVSRPPGDPPAPPSVDQAAPSRAYLPDEYAWIHRPVLIFGPPGDPRLQTQADRFADVASACEERDIVVLVNPSGPTRFGLTPDQFAVLLIGRDTGEKARWNATVAPQAVFELIDTMPMRRNEMGR